MATQESAKGFMLSVTPTTYRSEHTPIFAFKQIDTGLKKQTYAIKRCDLVAEALIRILQGEPSAKYRHLTLTRDAEGGVTLSIKLYENEHFGPWGDAVCRTLGFALRADAAPDGPKLMNLSPDLVQEMCQALGGDFLLPLEEMPQFRRRQERFHLLRAYCYSNDAEPIWANRSGWGWEQTLIDSQGKELYVVVRYYPDAGLVCISERYKRRWRRPFALYYPEEEAQAIAHLRSIL